MDVDAEPQQNNPSKAPKPHDVLWFPDGNVVLATDTYLFKVYKGLLSMNSSFFRDMFELPYVGSTDSTTGKDGGMELYEGLPLVMMVGDDGEDVADLLRATYERNYYDHHNDDTPLETVIALLKLSTKYDFKEIRKDVILQIANLYPTSLQEFDSLGDRYPPLFGEERVNCHVPLLAAALEANADVLLPILYFSCSNVDIGSIVDDPKSMALMKPECLRAFIKGREAVETDISRLVADLPEGLSIQVGANASGPGCLTMGSCLREARYTRLSELINVEFHDTKGSTIVDSHLSPVCANCSSFVAKAIDDKREKIWAEMPSYFGCPEWDVIQARLKEIENS